MRPPVTILQHDPESPAGAIIDALDEFGVFYEIRRLSEGDSLPNWPTETAGVISLGGHANVKHAGHAEVSLLRRIVHEGGPVWGIGLGAELLTLATGGEVYQKRKPELGWVTVEKVVDDPLLHGVASPFVAFCWHARACKLSPTSHLTAEHGGEVEAFRAGGRAWATQFHPEITAEIAHRWIEHGVRKHHDLEPAFVERLQERTDQLMPEHSAFCRRLTLNFISGSDLLP